MPWIQANILRGEPDERLEELMMALSKETAQVLSVPLERIRVVINEYDPSRWGVGGAPVVPVFLPRDEPETVAAPTFDVVDVDGVQRHDVGDLVDWPMAWTRDQLLESGDWVRRLTDDEIAALERVGRRFVADDPDLRTVAAADYPIPELHDLLGEIAESVDAGRGFLVVRGLPVHLYSDAVSGAILYVLGLHLGDPMRQNQLGDVLDSVRATSDRTRETDPYALGSRIRDALAFHSDASDIVTLLCLRTSRTGGESSLLSSAALFNEFAKRHPDLVPTLFEPFHFDWYRQDHDAPERTYSSPICSLEDGVFSMVSGTPLIRWAQEYDEVPRLTEAQLAAIDLLDEIVAEDDGLVLDMELEPGDMQWVCNYTVQHSRRSFEDHDEYERRRHLLRLWLRRDGRPLPERFGRHVVLDRRPATDGPDDAGNFSIARAVMPRPDWGNTREQNG